MNDNLTSIIVDDEINARENLRLLLQSYCPDIKIVGEAANVDDAIQLIQNKTPQLVFLDIEMPKKDGFQLVYAFKNMPFKIIFITAYDHYAIKAFQIAALDYLLKPIDIQLLKNAVKKAKQHEQLHSENEKLRLLKINEKAITKIAIAYKNDYAIIAIHDILCIEADRMYTTVYTVSGKTYMASKPLQHYENLLVNNSIIRVHRSWLVNLSHIDIYSKKDHSITLNTSKKIPLSKSFKTAFEMVFKI